MRTLTIIVGLLAVFTSLVSAQEVMTNESIIKRIKAGLGEDTILVVVNQQPATYSLKADDLVALKSAGVSDKIIAAIVAKGQAKTATPAPAATNTSDPAPPVNEIGLYYKRGDQWLELLPEVVNWKTGGVLKSIASAGIVQKDVNGMVLGPNSRNSVKTPVEILVYASEEVAITEYQLPRLRQKEDRREFRTVTGGVLHQSGGATRDLVPFEGRKIAPRTWVVLLPNIGAGEYGFLAPGAVSTQHASAQLGKMYTFRLLE
jgi:hypothetical protein